MRTGSKRMKFNKVEICCPEESVLLKSRIYCVNYIETYWAIYGIRHTVVSLLYRCSVCKSKGEITADLQPWGKHFDFGHYKEFNEVVKSKHVDFTIKEAIDKVHQMPGKYRLFKYNCHHWGKAYYKLLTQK